MPLPSPKTLPVDPTILDELEALERDLKAIEQRKAGIAAKIPDGVPVLRKRGDEQAIMAIRGQMVVRPVFYLEDLPK